MNQDGKHFDTMADAMVGADVFIGVSAPGLVTKEMVASMNEKSCVLAMANPTPEIMPEDALAAGAYIVGTGRSDYPNPVSYTHLIHMTYWIDLILPWAELSRVYDESTTKLPF